MANDRGRASTDLDITARSIGFFRTEQQYSVLFFSSQYQHSIPKKGCLRCEREAMGP